MKNRIATGVDVECVYQEDSSTPVLDREKIYWELSEQTHGKTRLGPYILHKESLYVDGYTHQIPTTTTNTWRPSLEAFTLNFTITNLLYTEDLGQKDSIKFKSTEKILQNMVRVATALICKVFILFKKLPLLLMPLPLDNT
ncbi:mucin-16-like isoform X1 [Monodelphis domestica]|uniref:mucin-16-like isoform X1 n=1 Tax=Monodelphis domestica TaxID=13616 RepID=UPI0024E20311|nr:mucin-16-like isoform X1 [Monodelphis domestica]